VFVYLCLCVSVCERARLYVGMCVFVAYICIYVVHVGIVVVTPHTQ
jgi:hypothetical protein